MSRRKKKNVKPHPITINVPEMYLAAFDECTREFSSRSAAIRAAVEDFLAEEVELDWELAKIAKENDRGIKVLSVSIMDKKTDDKFNILMDTYCTFWSTSSIIRAAMRKYLLKKLGIEKLKPQKGTGDSR